MSSDIRQLRRKLSEFFTRIRDDSKKSRDWPIPVASRSKARFCARLLAGVAGSNRADGCRMLRVLQDSPIDFLYTIVCDQTQQ